MRVLIGIDEAGYGPNLGPLVIGASAWCDGSRSCDSSLDDWRTRQLEPTDEGLPQFADSKLLYSPTKGLALLEANVLAALGGCGICTDTWLALITGVSYDSADSLQGIPWFRDFHQELPVSATQAQVAALLPWYGPQEQQGAEWQKPTALMAKVIAAQQFNQLLEQFETKAALLSVSSLALVRSAMDRMLPEFDATTFTVVCDKHGGRNHYAPLLCETFGTSLVRVREESRAVSRYIFDYRNRPVDIRFCKGGEAYLPTALASMVAKYLREICMLAFNRFWQQHVPGLRQTAGYPVDAKRFAQDIAAAQTQLEIPDGDLWRAR